MILTSFMKSLDVHSNICFPRGSRFWHACRLVPDSIQRILDYGCFDGAFLAGLSLKAASRYGVDRNAHQIQSNIVRYPEVKFKTITDVCTGFADEYFDAVSCLEVLEHVPNESELLSELCRIMQPEATLVLSVPHEGLLAVFDTGNIKFRFPWLVKFYYHHIKRDPQTYQRRFVEAEHGLVGDVSVSEHMEHKHYTIDQITTLLSPYFRVEKTVYYGLLTPLIDMLKILLCLVMRFEFMRPILERLDDFDKRFSYGVWSYNVMVQAIRLPKASA